MEINHDGGNIKTCDPEILENFEYAASALLLNIGKLPKDAIIYIDNVKVYDEAGKLLSSEDFENATVAEYDKTKTAYYLGWQNAATFEIVEEPTTGISNIESANVAKDGKSFNLAGQQANGGTDLGRCKSGDFYSQDPHLCTKECREITGSGDFSAWYEPGPWVSAESDAMECAG